MVALSPGKILSFNLIPVALSLWEANVLEEAKCLLGNVLMSPHQHLGLEAAAETWATAKLVLSYLTAISITTICNAK